MRMFEWSGKCQWFCLFLGLIVILQFFTTHSIYAQIIVENEEIPKDKILFTKPLIGYRKFSPEPFSTNIADEKSGIPVDVFIESAKATPIINHEIKKAGKDPTNATTYDWYTASKTARWGICPEHQQMPWAISVSSKAYKSVTVDPYFVARLPETEIFKSDKLIIYSSKVVRTERHVKIQATIEYMEVDPKVYKDFENSYKLLSSAKDLSPTMTYLYFNQASSCINSYPFLAAAAEFTAGDVTFGVPMVFSPKDCNLDIPQSITSKADVYLIIFAVSFHNNIDFRNVEKLTFSISAPAGVLAIELIPLKFDKDMCITETFSSPKLKFKYGDKAVELGKFYEQTVVYKSLKPIIVAYGLQENNFSWAMMDDAVQAGANRFIALLKVPKGKELVTVQLQVCAQTKQGWFAQGDLIAIKPELVEIPLKK